MKKEQRNAVKTPPQDSTSEPLDPKFYRPSTRAWTAAYGLIEKGRETSKTDESERKA